MTSQQIAQQMRTYSAAWRAQGITQVPIAWLDYWATEIERGSYSAYPAYQYDTFYVPGLLQPLRQVGTFNYQIDRGFTLFR